MLLFFLTGGVMLIRVAGMGINLTAASVVIMYVCHIEDHCGYVLMRI